MFLFYYNVTKIRAKREKKIVINSYIRSNFLYGENAFGGISVMPFCSNRLKKKKKKIIDKYDKLNLVLKMKVNESSITILWCLLVNVLVLFPMIDSDN